MFTHLNHKLSRRGQRGQAITLLMVFASVLIVLVCGMAGFELARYSLCSQELSACVDSAALGGAAGLTSSNNTNQTTSQSIAISTAEWVWEQNTILLTPLVGNSTYTTSFTPPTMTPPANKAQLNFNWLDPLTRTPTNNQASQLIMHITGAFGYSPLVGQFLGIGLVYDAYAQSDGAGPQLDVVLCFDLSSSIDDATQVSYAQRYYTSGNKNQYTQIAPNGTGQLYTTIGCTNTTGSGINACYPQGLEGVAGNAGGGHTPLNFDNVQRGPQQGAKPGKTGFQNGNIFTDCVVNLDENGVFGGYTSPAGFAYPSLGALVEAARGNLESNAIATAANVNLPAIGVSNPRAGYYQDYWSNALLHRHPLYDAQASSSTFFQILNNSVDAHFGFDGFSGAAASSAPGYSISSYAIADGAAGTTLTFPMGAPSGNYPTTDPSNSYLPYVPLEYSPGPSFSQFTTIMGYLPPVNPPAYPQLNANGSTDINGSLNRALMMLATNSQWSYGVRPTAPTDTRPAAKRAIVLFTDGLPTANTGPFGDTAATQITTVAASCNVAIYCIGLAQNAAIVPSQNALLAPIAAGTGGKYYQIPPGTGQAAALDKAFEDIARSLVQLTR